MIERMGIILEAVRRRVSEWKLSRGRCAECGTILRDDSIRRFCSEACELDQQARYAY